MTHAPFAPPISIGATLPVHSVPLKSVSAPPPKHSRGIVASISRRNMHMEICSMLRVNERRKQQARKEDLCSMLRVNEPMHRLRDLSP